MITPQTSFDLEDRITRWWEHLWEHVPIEHPIGRELADRHYSRQSEGAVGYVPHGQRFLLLHRGVDRRGAPAHAIWSVCRNRFREVWRFRNTIFRNETTTRSSILINRATKLSMEVFERRYGLPDEQLTTEVDVAATAKRRSKRAFAGISYWWAFWEHGATIAPGHGRPERAVWVAPQPVFYGPVDRSARASQIRLAVDQQGNLV